MFQITYPSIVLVAVRYFNYDSEKSSKTSAIKLHIYKESDLSISTSHHTLP